MGFVIDFSEQSKEKAIRDFVIDVAMNFDISRSVTHFSYIPYSIWPGEYNDLQWLNNSAVANMTSGNKTALRLYLNEVVRKDPDTGFEKGNHIFAVCLTLLIT